MDALRAQMRGFVPFALMFTMVCWIWYEHNIFFRRYGLEDAWTAFLNSVLLFTVLFYVYPLKFLTTKLVASFTGGGGEPLLAMDGAYVMLLYSGGVVLIFAVFTLLHRHAWNRREALGLSAAERLDPRLQHAGPRPEHGGGVGVDRHRPRVPAPLAVRRMDLRAHGPAARGQRPPRRPRPRPSRRARPGSGLEL